MLNGMFIALPKLFMVKQSALLDLYRARGATLIEREGWLLPAYFGDSVAEYHAVRNHVGILDLCQRNLLRFTGDERISFLNDWLSNDLGPLTPGQGLDAGYVRRDCAIQRKRVTIRDGKKPLAATVSLLPIIN